jgi:DNA-binding XRE family transcriptional regulator
VGSQNGKARDKEIHIMNYREHRKQLLDNPKVSEEYETLAPEYELAKSLIEARLKNKMTQDEVAKKAGMPQSTISRIEGLTHGLPKLSTLQKIADALDSQIVITLKPKAGRR